MKGEFAKCKEGRLFKTDVRTDSKNYSRCGVSHPCRSCWDRTPRLSCARRASLASFTIIWITCTTSNVFNVSKEYGIFMNQVQGITKAQQNFELVIGDFVNGDNLLTRP